MTFTSESSPLLPVVLADLDEWAERRACGCYFDAPCDCYSSYDNEYAHDDHYDDYDHSGQDYDFCEGVADDCPFGGCRDCDGDVDDDSGFLPEDAAMESGLFGDC